MKTLVKLISILIFIQFAFGCKPTDRLAAKLEELDELIENQTQTSEVFLSENAGILLALEQEQDDSLKWEYAYSLFYRYSHWDTDSTISYLNRMSALSYDNPTLEMQSKVCRALSFAISGEKEKALGQISGTYAESVGDSFVSRYFIICEEVFDQLKEEQERVDLFYESLSWEDKFSYAQLQFAKAEIESGSNNDDSAMALYRSAFESSDSEQLKSRCAFRMAVIYENWGDDELMKYWMTIAAINDQLAPCRDTKPLYNLALILFKNKDLDRASTYIRQIIENSIHIGQNTHLILSSLETQQAISDALDYNKSAKLNILTGASSALVLMLVIILILLANTSKDRKRINQSKLALAETNKQLKDSNLIKENFMFRYMQMSIRYLAAVEDYRHRLRKTLREDGAEALKTMLRTPLESENYDEFYRIFDENFLKLYPDFIKNVNTLLPPDEQFDPDMKEMGTQLRILATIRLGLTDSGQIAKFLNCASSSIYSYRSRLKHKALCGSEEFEYRIKNFN